MDYERLEGDETRAYLRRLRRRNRWRRVRRVVLGAGLAALAFADGKAVGR